MSRSRPADDLAYGEMPQRWDRDRFERFGRGPPVRYEEDFRFTERDRPGRRDVTVVDRIDERAPGIRFEERDRYYEDDRYTARRPRRRTDRELFGDVDPRELANMSLTPYLRRSASREEIEIDRRGSSSRPGMLRRQSSLDVFDRQPGRYERDDYRLPAYTPVPLPIRRREDDFERVHYRDPYEPEAYREVEIQRERSVHRRAPKSESGRSHKSKAKSVKSKAPSSRSSSSTSTESFEEVTKEESIRESIVDTERKFKKGKTRMPKRLVRREAVMDLGYPFDEEEDFFVLRMALEKEQIDEVIKISETYTDGEKTEENEYTYEERIDITEPAQQREEVIRTEWLNPASVAGSKSHRSRSRRDPSPSSRSSTTRRTSPARTERTHRTSRSRRQSSVTRYEEAPPPPPPPAEYYEEKKEIIEERRPEGTLVLAERDYRSERDIQSEIRSLEAERRALRLEREAEHKRDRELVRVRESRPAEEEFALVEYRSRSRPAREVLEIVDRPRSPPKNVVRVEKDRKARRQAKLVAAAMATLT